MWVAHFKCGTWLRASADTAPACARVIVWFWRKRLRRCCSIKSVRKSPLERRGVNNRRKKIHVGRDAGNLVLAKRLLHALYGNGASFRPRQSVWRSSDHKIRRCRRLESRRYRSGMRVLFWLLQVPDFACRGQKIVIRIFCVDAYFQSVAGESDFLLALW